MEFVDTKAVRSRQLSFRHRVALIVGDSADSTQMAFMSQMLNVMRPYPTDTTVIDAGGCMKTLNTELDRLSEHSFDTILTCGVWTTHVVAERLNSVALGLHQLPVHLYVCSADSRWCDRVWGTRTNRGVRRCTSSSRYISNLRTLHPSARRVMIPFDRALATQLPEVIAPLHDHAVLKEARSQGLEVICVGIEKEDVDLANRHAELDSASMVDSSSLYSDGVQIDHGPQIKFGVTTGEANKENCKSLIEGTGMQGEALIRRAHSGDVVMVLPHSGVDAMLAQLGIVCADNGLFLYGEDVAAPSPCLVRLLVQRLEGACIQDIKSIEVRYG